MKPKSIRPFIGAKDFNQSREFYRELGFKEVEVSHDMSYFDYKGFGFYLQKAYVKDWVDNSMLFLEVEDVDAMLHHVKSLNLTEKYDRVRLSEIHYNDWGQELFLHDPSGILWHIGNFKTEK